MPGDQCASAHAPIVAAVDHDDFHHDGHNFTAANRYMYHMMNFSFGAEGALKEECRAAFPDSPWLCFMAPHMQRFITTPFFMMQSKYDFWQMGNVRAKKHFVLISGRSQ